MLEFFRSALPTRLVLLILLALGLRLPLIWLGEVPLSLAELRGWLVGERLHAGALLYREVYDHTAPLAAAVYALLDVALPRSWFLYRLLALALVLVQAVRLNQVLNRYNVHPERGYLAALTYVLLASASAELDTLSPLLIGQTFVVFALSSLLPTSREGYDSSRLFRAGFLLGLAALCFLPLAWLLLLGLFAVISFAANTFRSFLLLLCGFAFPYAVVATFFLYTDALPLFRQLHLEPMLNWAAGADALPRTLQLQLLILPGVVVLLGVLRMFTASLGLVFQVKFQQLMLVWLAVALVMGAALRGAAPGLLAVLLAPAAYFGLYLWQRTRRVWIAEVLLLLVVGAVVTVRYRTVLGLDELLHLPAEARYAARPEPRYAALQGQPVLVLGRGRGAYVQNYAATPYLDWTLAQRDFGRLNEYAAVFRLAQNLPQPPPYLIDEAGLLPELRYKLPTIFGRYERTSTPRVYRLK
ncbi:hypothetical protein EJV47_15895 [Hymenobacter gummosus]|uniref:Glycosyltransferase RgtA/B/C/D-like domain-containing protein n=1 Tax=Hymenobacter gummosus TaxID=1776032 RepID=A0A431U092_9BACT|nr:hypothetical protein [Hymenobacter gummosus]RTQ48453.1 hypothetical protein EJV47_15895 [Hymenobacter gummosus]